METFKEIRPKIETILERENKKLIKEVERLRKENENLLNKLHERETTIKFLRSVVDRDALYTPKTPW